MTINIRPLSRKNIILISIIITFILLILLWQNITRLTSQGYPDDPKLIFRGRFIKGRYTIPCVVNKAIWLQSSFGKGSVYAILDTGSTTFSCPNDITNEGVVWQDNTSYGWALPSSRPAKIMVLPHIFLPGCELRDCPVIAYDRLPGESNYTDPIVVPLSIFKNYAVTIDFKSSRLIISNKKLDLRLASSPFPRNDLDQAVWLPLIRTYHGTYGPYPVIEGTVNGERIKMLIDTGSTGGIWVISSNVGENIRKKHSNNDSHVAKKDQENIADWSMGSIKGNAQIMIAPVDESDLIADVSIGNDILRNYRITIDYQNDRVCFERYKLISRSNNVK